jgi:hypothetical protein
MSPSFDAALGGEGHKVARSAEHGSRIRANAIAALDSVVRLS